MFDAFDDPGFGDFEGIGQEDEEQAEWAEQNAPRQAPPSDFARASSDRPPPRPAPRKFTRQVTDTVTNEVRRQLAPAGAPGFGQIAPRTFRDGLVFGILLGAALGAAGLYYYQWKRKGR